MEAILEDRRAVNADRLGSEETTAEVLAPALPAAVLLDSGQQSLDAQPNAEPVATALATAAYASELPANVWLELPVAPEPSLPAGPFDSEDESSTSSWSEQVDTALSDAVAGPLAAASQLTGGYAYAASPTMVNNQEQGAADAIFSEWEESSSAL